MTDHTTSTLAEQALEVYDRKGEKAMLAFLMEHEQPLPTDEDSIQTGIYSLADGSIIEHMGDEESYYTIFNSPNMERRRANIPLNEQPGYIDQNIPLLPTPNSGNVIKEIMDWAESAAREDLDLTSNDDELISLYDVATLMPGIGNALKTAMAAQEQKPAGRRMPDYLDQMVTDCARDVLEDLPPEEFQALITAAAETLQKG